MPGAEQSVIDAGRTRALTIAREGGDGLRRIESNVTFARACQIPYGRAVYAFEAGETFRLFFSYRHTPQRLVGQLSPHGLSVAAHWINATGEEGVFDCLRGV